MKLKKLCRYMTGLFTALLPLAGCLAADMPSVDDASVMSRIVVQPMLPIAMTSPVDTGTLLFSDSPEYATADGILYSDRVEGDVRLYFYHVNQQGANRKIVAMLYNPQPYPVEVTLQGYQYTRPSKDYYQVGKELSTMYYEGDHAVNKITVPARGYALAGQRLNETVVRPEELFSGIVDLKIPEPMILSSMIMPVPYDPIQFVKQQVYLPSDSVKLRGTFTGKDRYLTNLIPYEPKSGIGYILLADGIGDRFLQGWDDLDKRRSEDTGNYGVDYTVRFVSQGQGNLNLYFNTQGGEYAGVAELIYTDDQGNEDKKIIDLPRSRHSMGLNDPFAMEYVDTFPAGKNLTIHFMPPGAANLPVRFIVVPDDKLQPIQEMVKEDRDAQEQRAQAYRSRAAAAAQTDNTVEPETLQSDSQTEFTSLKDRLAKLQDKDQKQKKHK